MRPLAVALGDPAGIGPEVVAGAWERRASERLPPFVAVGDPDAVRAVWRGPVCEVGDLDASGFADALPVLPVGLTSDASPGAPTPDGARVALRSLEIAADLALAGEAGGIVTAPVSKAELYAIGFRHPGQTEWVTARCGLPADATAMMLAGPTLRTVPVTTHLPLAKVPGALSVERIVAQARITLGALSRDFGIAAPRLAVAGLNPHAGEGGALGREDEEVVRPAVDQVRRDGQQAQGPLPADTMFHPRARAGYDAALCMYHDQALIPLKALHFDEGVNVTLGLPIVRTAPDHGTAFAIAGKGLAEPGAMSAAIRMAGEMAARRAA